MNRDGWLVVRNVLSASECDRALSEMRDDPSCHHAHSDLMWRMRTHPRVQAAFAAAWGCREEALVSSFDGASLRDPGDAPFVLDWHVDQNSTHDAGRVCLQAVLALTDVDASTGGTALLTGSHADHEALCRRLCDPHESEEEWEFLSVPHGDPVLQQHSECQPCLVAGSMLMWDSRTVHRVVAPAEPESTSRAVVYLSMVPRSFVSDDVLRLRAKAFREGVATTHWCSRFVDRGAARHAPSRATAASLRVKRLVGMCEA